MTFKEQMEADINIVLNSEEFAELHNIEGSAILCSVDSNEKCANSDAEMGITESDITIFVKTSTLEENGIHEIEYGEHLSFDKAIYSVVSWSDNLGITQIDLSRDVG